MCQGPQSRWYLQAAAGGRAGQPVPGRLAAASASGGRAAGSARSARAMSTTPIDHPIFPTTGSAAARCRWIVAGLGGNTQLRDSAGGSQRVLSDWRTPAGPRSGFRARAYEYIKPYGGTSLNAPDLREAVPRRRVQHPRVRPPHASGRATSVDRPRPRRQQEPALQRGVPDQHHGAGPPGPLLRRGPGPGWRPEFLLEGTGDPGLTYPGCAHSSVRGDFYQIPFNPFTSAFEPADQQDRQDELVQDVDRRGDPVLHAGAERAVPVMFCGEPPARGVLDNNPGRRRSARSGSRWGRRSRAALSHQLSGCRDSEPAEVVARLGLELPSLDRWGEPTAAC